MAVQNKKEENDSLINSSDIGNLGNVFTLALKGAQGNRVDLKNVLTYEDIFKLKLERTLKVLKEKAKAK